MNKMLVIPLALALVGLLGQHAFARNELLPNPDHSMQYNDGYQAGFLGVHPIAEHTKQFWQGYRNGTEGYGWAKRIIPSNLCYTNLLNETNLTYTNFKLCYFFG
jgi:hypothetical protein